MLQVILDQTILKSPPKQSFERQWVTP